MTKTRSSAEVWLKEKGIDELLGSYLKIEEDTLLIMQIIMSHHATWML